jgi:hypothetical protein
VDGGAIESSMGQPAFFGSGARRHRGDKLINLGSRRHAEPVQNSIAEHCC